MVDLPNPANIPDDKLQHEYDEAGKRVEKSRSNEEAGRNMNQRTAIFDEMARRGKRPRF